MAPGWTGYAPLGQPGLEPTLNARSLTLAGAGRVEVRDVALPTPGPGQVAVTAELSAISAGTELLAYRGQTPEGMSVTATDDTAGLGYSLVGSVTGLGPGVDPAWLGNRVFALHPHASHLVCLPDQLVRLPPELSWEDAVFLSNMDTAVNLVQDGHPRLGENVAVFGLGVVGLLTAAVLARFPIELQGFDPVAARREKAQELGVGTPEQPASYDLCFECSGQPQALNDAIQHTGFSGRIVVGSWYGLKRAEIDLGGVFHRNRIQIVSSQVSSLNPALSGLWTRERRLQVALQQLTVIRPARLISHRFPIERAAEAYALLDRREGLQAVLTYAP